MSSLAVASPDGYGNVNGFLDSGFLGWTSVGTITPSRRWVLTRYSISY